MTKAGMAAMAATVAVSPVTVWELPRKASLGKLPALPGDPRDFVGWLESEQFLFSPLTWTAAEHANTLPPHHKDPMERLLIAQALVGGLAIITNDRLFPSCGVPTIW